MQLPTAKLGLFIVHFLKSTGHKQCKIKKCFFELYVLSNEIDFLKWIENVLSNVWFWQDSVHPPEPGWEGSQHSAQTGHQPRQQPGQLKAVIMESLDDAKLSSFIKYSLYFVTNQLS